MSVRENALNAAGKAKSEKSTWSTTLTLSLKTIAHSWGNSSYAFSKNPRCVLLKGGNKIEIKSGKKAQVPGSYPFKVTHIGVITKDMDRTIKRYEAMGVGPFERFRLPDARFKFKKRWMYDVDLSAHDHVCDVAYGQMSGGFGVEIYQLIKVKEPKKSIPQQYLDAKDECVWHLGHDVENMDEAIA